jgi:hypothetical protein
MYCRLPLFLVPANDLVDGETDGNQLFPFIGQTSFALAPGNENNRTCILPGNDRLESGPCPDDGSQLFSIFE